VEKAQELEEKNSSASGKVLGDLPHTRDPQSAILSLTVILASQAKEVIHGTERLSLAAASALGQPFPNLASKKAETFRLPEM